MNRAIATVGGVLHSALTLRDRLAGPRPGLLLLGWHAVAQRGGGLATSTDAFRAHLDVIAEWGATVVPLDEAARRLAAGDLPARSVSLTFDDGYAGVAELAWPELAARGWPATLFAVSGYLDGVRTFPWDDPADPAARLLDAAALRDVAAAGLDVGSHTVNHRWLPHLDGPAVAEEVSRSKAELEDLLGRPVTSFAYPMGGWDRRVRTAVAAAGYEIAVTVDRGRNVRGADPLALRRAFAPEQPSDVLRILSGAYTFLHPVDRWRTRNGPAWQS